MNELNIIFEDDQILVLEKPAGLVVNRSDTVFGETLQDQLSDYFKLGQGLGIGDRAGIVHRLDRETSGLLIIAKTQTAFLNLQAQFKNREVVKEYAALVHGAVKEDEGTIDKPIIRIGKNGRFGIANRDDIGAKGAVTSFGATARFRFDKKRFGVLVQELSLTRSRTNYFDRQARDYSFILVVPKTGRTHQIRVHFKSIGHPLVSDLIYAPGKLLKFDLLWCPRLFLHAKSLEFTHPASGKRIFFDSDLPNDLKDAMLNLKEI